MNAIFFCSWQTLSSRGALKYNIKCPSVAKVNCYGGHCVNIAVLRYIFRPKLEILLFLCKNKFLYLDGLACAVFIVVSYGVV